MPANLCPSTTARRRRFGLDKLLADQPVRFQRRDGRGRRRHHRPDAYGSFVLHGGRRGRPTDGLSANRGFQRGRRTTTGSSASFSPTRTREQTRKGGLSPSAAIRSRRSAVYEFPAGMSISAWPHATRTASTSRGTSSSTDLNQGPKPMRAFPPWSHALHLHHDRRRAPAKALRAQRHRVLRASFSTRTTSSTRRPRSRNFPSPAHPHGRRRRCSRRDRCMRGSGSSSEGADSGGDRAEGWPALFQGSIRGMMPLCRHLPRRRVRRLPVRASYGMRRFRHVAERDIRRPARYECDAAGGRACTATSPRLRGRRKTVVIAARARQA